MQIVTLDLETYYSSEYSLTKLTTEEYIRSPAFEVIGIGIKINDDPTVWYPKPQVADAIAAIDWASSFVIAQNTAFDGAILSWHYGVAPCAWIDIMGMSRALYPHEKSHALSSQAKRAGIGEKGDEVLNAIGKRYADFSPEQLARYGEYCKNDVDLTHKLFMLYADQKFPGQELKLLDLTLRLFIEPVLELDENLLRAHLSDVKDRKEVLLDTVRNRMLEGAKPEFVHMIFSEGEEGLKKLLMSNEKFAEALRVMGVDPPMKLSATTGKMAYAFAKTDEAMKALSEHPNEEVQALVAARLGHKTTLEETRTERFIGMATRGKFPVPLRYYGAHSGRWSGQDKVNLQNIPARGMYANKLKKAIKPPPGYVIIDCDSSQIEARTLAWMAGQTDLVQAFEDKKDVYKIMASRIYNIPESEVTEGAGSQRQVGKTVVLGCFGPDTLVLTQRGWVSIIQVQGTDMVWDGLKWVSHAGLVPQGEKDVWTAYGLSATSDHEILTEHGWAEWHEVIENPSRWKSAKLVASLLSVSGAHIRPPGVSDVGGTLSANVHADGSASFFGKICSKAVALGAILAPKLRRILNGIGRMKAFAQKKQPAPAFSTESRRVSADATTPTTVHTRTTAGAASVCSPPGVAIASTFSSTFCPSRGTTSRVWSWIGLTWIKDMSRAIFASWGVQPTWQIAAALKTCKRGSAPWKQRMQTYDIAYAGPRNRYTVLTSEGPIIVHNCGYGVGHVKLRAFLKNQAGVQVSEDEARAIIQTYRTTYSRIPELWRRADDALRALHYKQEYTIDIPGLCKTDEIGITLPSGLHIQYPDLTPVLKVSVVGGAEKQGWQYTSKGLPTNVYGGLVTENICQAVARCVIGEQMLRIAKRYKVVLTVHDAVACIAPIEEAAEARAYVEECMSWRPKWAPGLPLACESGVGASYGEC